MTNDIASELAKLHELTGAEFSRQVERIANMHLFHSIDGEDNIYGIGGEKGKDYFVVKRKFALNPNFIRDFMMRYNKRKSR